MKGFTLFFALLVSSLALAVGLAIFDLTIREIDLSATTSQSQYAIYAADTGVECALYWDTNYPTTHAGSAFATSSYTNGGTFPPATGIVCDSQDIAAAAKTANTWPIQTAPNGPPTATAATSTFIIRGSPWCAIVTVAKSGNPSATSITSHGYNNCQGASLQLERVLQVSY